MGSSGLKEFEGPEFSSKGGWKRFCSREEVGEGAREGWCPVTAGKTGPSLVWSGLLWPGLEIRRERRGGHGRGRFVVVIVFVVFVVVFLLYFVYFVYYVYTDYGQREPQRPA